MTQTQGVAVVGKVGKITCHFDHDVDLPLAAAARDFTCSVPSPVTGELLIADRQVMLATPVGKAVLECKFGPAKGKPVPAVAPQLALAGNPRYDRFEPGVVLESSWAFPSLSR